MSTLEIYSSSVETIYYPIKNVHPTTGAVDMSALTVEVALPAVGVSPSTWVTASWATGTIHDGDHRYYVVQSATSGFTLTAGTTYQPWVRVGGASGSVSKVPTTIKAINT